MDDLARFWPVKRFFAGLSDGASGSEIERGEQRVRRINLTALTSLGFRGALLLSGFIYVPLAVHYLGPERYGLWVAMTSVMTLLAFADCGIGYGLMNHVAYATGHGEKGSIQKSISSTFFVLFAIALFGCLLFAAAYPLIPWQSLFRTRTHLDAVEAARAVAVMVVSFLITLPFTTVQRVQAACQEGFETQLWEIAGVAFSLFGLLSAIRMHAGLPVLAIVFSLGPLIALVLNWVVYFFFRRPAQVPVLRLVDFQLARQIVHEGGYFFILQITAVMVFSLDSFIVLHYFGLAELGKYSLVAKLFQVMPALAGVWFAPLWPAYAESIARGDHEWVQRTLFRSTLFASLGSALVSSAVALLSKPMIHLWTGTDVNPSIWLLAGFVLYSIIVVGTGAVAAYLNGRNFIRGQAVLVFVTAALSVGLKILLSNYGNISGAIWGTNLAFLLVVIPAYIVVVPRLLREHQTLSTAQTGFVK
jgi:O-antigen/teichoic acid export membrane protein